MNPGIVLIGGILLILLAAALLLGLQIWLAGKKKMLPGLIQPGVWCLFAVISNLLPRMDGTAVQSGVSGIGAIVMAVLSLIVFLFARSRLK
ncbi:MAG: hypothetical protein IKU72_01595 [Oscillospiraceae bacterium]|nr:hypothetical protein [Oscillospiraceae bacterium]